MSIIGYNKREVYSGKQTIKLQKIMRIEKKLEFE